LEAFGSFNDGHSAFSLRVIFELKQALTLIVLAVQRIVTILHFPKALIQLSNLKGYFRCLIAFLVVNDKLFDLEVLFDILLLLFFEFLLAEQTFFIRTNDDFEGVLIFL